MVGNKNLGHYTSRRRPLIFFDRFKRDVVDIFLKMLAARFQAKNNRTRTVLDVSASELASRSATLCCLMESENVDADFFLFVSHMCFSETAAHLIIPLFYEDSNPPPQSHH